MTSPSPIIYQNVEGDITFNLQLADGVDLPDPKGLIEGTGKRIRHVKIRDVEAASSPAVIAILRAQLAARPEA